MILLSDPRLPEVEVAECGEPLIDISSLSSVQLDTRERDEAGAYSRVRTGIGTRLEAASAYLPTGVHLRVIEGHRSVAEQARRFAGYEERLCDSGLTGKQLYRQVSMFVSPVQVAPHCAGAAVDLTLADDDGRELDMGGPVNGHRYGQEQSCPWTADGLSSTARHHRDLLGAALTSVGFVNYPTEWWHWSYGDRYWAYISGAKAAIYGPV
ncbi:M15 family metallopeptidase [Streptomyces sp. BF23-18]|uniref:M15 family metallopeptidase n=1 Tax=Streptomyces sp. BF23-18 TaxID=3240282 RepID=UPI0034E57F09